MELFNYQKKILEDVKDLNACGLFLEAGTGKTITSLYKHKSFHNNKLLVICPASKVNEWEVDIKNICPEIEYVVPLNHGSDKNRYLLNQYVRKVENVAFIISFQSAIRLPLDYYTGCNWTVIIDESHFIKNRTAKISKLCHKIGARTDYKIILTGTPQNKGYIDYFSQLKFLGVLDKVTDFMNTYCITDIAPWGGGRIKEIVGYKNTGNLDRIIKNNCIFFKRDVNEKDIPSEIFIDFNKNVLYNKYKKDKIYKDITAPNSGVLRMRLRQICSGFIGEEKIGCEKELWVKEFLESINTRVVIFYNFEEERKILTELINKPLSIYCGTVKDIKNFQENEDSVILVNYASGGTGINWLSKAYVAIFYSPPESYLMFEQSRKRLDRIGQDHKPLFYKLRTLKTVEKVIYETIEKGEDFDDRKFNDYMKGEENDQMGTSKRI